jgi:hypothetical protein
MDRPDVRSPLALLAALLVLGAVAVAAGCGSGGVGDLPPAAEPPRSPPPAREPAGRVLPLDGEPEGIVADPATGLLAIGLRKPAALALVDGHDGEVRRTVALPGRPRHLTLAGPGGPVLVPAEPANTFLAVGLPSGRVLQRVRVGAYPHDLTALAGGAYAVGDERGNTLSVVRDGRVARRIPIAMQPGGVTTIDDGRTLAIVSVRERVLELYDARTLRQTGRASAGVGPTHVACVKRDWCYVLDTRGGALLVFTRDPDLELVRRLYLPGGPYGIALDEEHDRLFVTLLSRNEVVELPAHGRPHVLRRWPTVRQPNSVAIDPVTRRVYVAGLQPSALQVLSAAARLR